MNVLNFLKFLIPEYQILHAIRLYGLISLKQKPDPLEQEHAPLIYEQAIMVPVHPQKVKSSGSFARNLLFVVFIALLLYFITTTLFNLIEDILTVYSSGYVILEGMINLLIFILYSILIGLSLLIPNFRKMYYRLPWLFAYVTFFTLNSLSLAVALSILNLGHHTLNSGEATIYFLIMSGQLIVCRLLMCTLFYKKPLTHWGGAVE